MRSTIIIKIRGYGYVATVGAQSGHTVMQGARIGITPYDAATRAAELMLQYSALNSDGGDLMAPPEILALVPPHLHSVAANRAKDGG
jgi:hypothetical protein